MAKRFWLMKSEPSVFSLDDLRKSPGRRAHWDGVRNYQARNHMKEMKKGDLAIFYHSNCECPGAVGVTEVVREAYPDFTSWDPLSPYFDKASGPENPRWFMVDVKWKGEFPRPVSIGEMRTVSELRNMKLLQRGQRLSVMPVSEKEFRKICEMGERAGSVRA